MCSIIGMGLFKGHKLDSRSTITGLMSRLFKNAEVGGRAASGVSIMNEKKAHILRRALSGSQFVATDEFIKFMKTNLDITSHDNKTMSIIGHCRLPTQGSPSNNLNNHPQVIKDIIGVHNGVIGNDNDIFEDFKNDFNRLAEVDTEAIFQLINHYINTSSTVSTIEAIQHSASMLSGGFACGLQNTNHPYNLYLFRHNNPINIRFYKDLGVIFFATRMSFIESTVEGFLDNDDTEAFIDYEMITDSGMVFNLYDRSMCKFIFKDKLATEREKNAG